MVMVAPTGPSPKARVMSRRRATGLRSSRIYSRRFWVLDSIGLSNFKAFQQVALPLSRLTLLAGWNSSGKSTVLQAVAALRQSHEAGLLATEGLLLNGPYVELGTGRDVLHEDHVPARGVPEISIRTGSNGGLVERTFRYAPGNDLLTYAAPPTRHRPPAP